MHWETGVVGNHTGDSWRLEEALSSISEISGGFEAFSLLETRREIGFTFGMCRAFFGMCSAFSLEHGPSPPMGRGPRMMQERDSRFEEQLAGGVQQHMHLSKIKICICRVGGRLSSRHAWQVLPCFGSLGGVLSWKSTLQW